MTGSPDGSATLLKWTIGLLLGSELLAVIPIRPNSWTEIIDWIARIILPNSPDARRAASIMLALLGIGLLWYVAVQDDQEARTRIASAVAAERLQQTELRQRMSAEAAIGEMKDQLRDVATSAAAITEAAKDRSQTEDEQRTAVAESRVTQMETVLTNARETIADLEQKLAALRIDVGTKQAELARLTALVNARGETLEFPVVLKGRPGLLIVTREKIWHLGADPSDSFAVTPTELQMHGSKVQVANRTYDLKLGPQPPLFHNNEEFFGCWRNAACWSTLKQVHRALYEGGPLHVDASH